MKRFFILTTLAFFATFALYAASDFDSDDTEEVLAVEEEDREIKDDPSLFEEAKNGDHLAQYAYGVIQYRKGNNTEAARWWLKAAQSGHQMAQYQLGKLHRDGKGVKKDFVNAYFLFSLSADQGNEEALKSRNRLERIMSAKDLKDAQSYVKNVRKD